MNIHGLAQRLNVYHIFGLAYPPEKTIFYRPKVSKNVQNTVLRFSRIDRERRLAIIIVHEKLICEKLPLYSHHSFWTLLPFILIFRMKTSYNTEIVLLITKFNLISGKATISLGTIACSRVPRKGICPTTVNKRFSINIVFSTASASTNYFRWRGWHFRFRFKLSIFSTADSKSALSTCGHGGSGLRGSQVVSNLDAT